jgi:thiamine-phosphate diphosphorylase
MHSSTRTRPSGASSEIPFSAARFPASVRSPRSLASRSSPRPSSGDDVNELISRPIIAMVTDRRRWGATGEEALDGLVRSAQAWAQAGVNLIQVRERGLTDRSLVALVVRIRAVVANTAAKVIVNERTDIALAAGAAGVHLRSMSAPGSRVRAIVPEGFLIGRSVHAYEEALSAERDGACDYLIFGTVFPSTSKASAHAVAGVDALRHVCKAVSLPVVAIGGINEERAGEVAAAGAAGIAAIEMFARPGMNLESLSQIVARVRAAF